MQIKYNNDKSGEAAKRMELKRLIGCASGREECDLLIKNVKIFNVFTGEISAGEIALAGGKIAGIGYGYRGKSVYDGGGATAIPGLIDSHIHVESSLLSPEAFASLAAAHGTTGIVADPHEIVNVCGIEGAEYIKEAFSRLSVGGVNPIDVYLQLPSCVPATPFETSGAAIDAEETAREIGRELFFGLGEMMNYPAVISGEEETLEKLQAAQEACKPIDGHAPTVSGQLLNAYAASGIATDHESENTAECLEKIACGMFVQLRGGSSASNLKSCASAVNEFNFRRFLICSDDKNARDLMRKGHVDDALRMLVQCGIDPSHAVCMATKNVADCYGLRGKGAIAPAYDGDIVLVKDMLSFAVAAVFKAGVLTVENGKALFDDEQKYFPAAVKNTVRIRSVKADDLKLDIKSGRARAMKVRPYGLISDEEIVSVDCKDGDVILEGTSLLKIAVVERHFASGNIGLGLVKDFGLKGGALGITVAHDSHNMVMLGDNNEDMARIAAALEKAGGGMAIVQNGKEYVFPLDIAGLMSSASADEVIEKTESLTAIARKMGVKDCYEPFMTPAFLSLAVIPALKLTDRGLFDVTKFEFTTVEVKA